MSYNVFGGTLNLTHQSLMAMVQVYMGWTCWWSCKDLQGKLLQLEINAMSDTWVRCCWLYWLTFIRWFKVQIFNFNFSSNLSRFLSRFADFQAGLAWHKLSNDRLIDWLQGKIITVYSWCLCVVSTCVWCYTGPSGSDRCWVWVTRSLKIFCSATRVYRVALSWEPCRMPVKVR